jgi:predicted GNAT family N-acyltransferase
MATDATVRGSGVGRAMVADGLARVAERGGDLVWCDARVTAAGFYERMGFTVVTSEFDKPGIGPHVGMLRAVPEAGRPSRPHGSVDWVTPAGEEATGWTGEGR